MKMLADMAISQQKNAKSGDLARQAAAPAAPAAPEAPASQQLAVGAVPLALHSVVGKGGGFVCASCGQSFQRRGALGSHEKSCRSFPCEQCSRAGQLRTFRTMAAMHGHKTKCQFQQQARRRMNMNSCGGRLELELKRLMPWNPNSGPRDVCLGPIERRRAAGSAAAMSQVSTTAILVQHVPH